MQKENTCLRKDTSNACVRNHLCVLVHANAYNEVVYEHMKANSTQARKHMEWRPLPLQIRALYLYIKANIHTPSLNEQV
jgi:hypothetical protein